MIGTVIRVNWLNLKRDYVALGLTFVLPIIFLTIFAFIFGSMGSGGGSGGGPSAMKVIAVDLDGTDVSRRFIEALGEQDALTIVTTPRATDDEPAPAPYTRESGRRAVRTGVAPAAVVIPEGFGAGFGNFVDGGDPIELIHDPSNPLAQHTIAGLIQASAMMAAPDILMQSGLSQLEKYGGALTPEQRSAVDDLLPVLRGDETWESLADDDDGDDDDDDPTPSPEGADGPDAPADESASEAGFTGLVEVKATSARDADDASVEDNERSNSMVAYYAAGIGVMFLLFSMAGAAGSLLEEEESGTIERLLTSRTTMSTLLAGKWLFFAIVGAIQLTVMFVWGALVFDVDLFTTKHLAGFAVMTLFTAPAAAAFGMLLATLCRSRGQLSGLSTIIILIMSALGGSMVPRFVMPEFMNTTALFTFNGWALDGYLKVFWYDDPDAGLITSIAALGPQVIALVAMTIVFMLLARGLARRWETV